MHKHRDHTPPKWIRTLLRLFLDERILEASLGDLEEKFGLLLKKETPLWKAKLYYIAEGLGFLKMARRSKNTSHQTTINMIGHTLLFFTRLVKKDMSYYLVSLLGLTLSITSFMLITMFINDEIAYDKFHQNRENIYRVTTHLRLSEIDYDMATTAFPAAYALQDELGEIEQATRILKQDRLFKVDEKAFSEQVIFADSNFLDVFSFPFVLGDQKRALMEPASIVLTERSAKKYFGTKNPVGETMLMDGQSLRISGVIKDVPDQSHIHFDAIIPLSLQISQWKSETGLEGRENKWFWIGTYTYVVLPKTADVDAVRAKLPMFITKYFPDRYKAGGRLQLQPLTDIHLRSALSLEFEEGGNMLYLRLFSVVALVIMIVSSINLINLSYFKITSRLREVGIRKFLGQHGVRIIIQLSIESLLMGFTAFVFAYALCYTFLPPFNELVRKNLYLWSPANTAISLITLGVIVAICMLAVMRPAVRYASRPASFLLLHDKGKRNSSNARNVLIGLQVCFSFVLLVFSFIISSQIDFFRNKDLGFDKNNIVVVNLNEKIGQNLDAFRSDLKTNKEVLEVSGGNVPGFSANSWRFVPEGGSYEKPYLFPFISVSPNFIPTLNIKMISGRNFPEVDRDDSLMSFIINRRAAIELGWQDDAINKTIEMYGAGTTDIIAKGIVIGVIDDYHFESLRAPVKPIILTSDWSYGTLLIKTTGNNYEDAITAIGNSWKKFSDEPFNYEVLEEKLDQLYVKETRLSSIILFFTFIALYLTCYGLFAMSSLLFSSRLKEVAIRKVFGADQLSIVKQLYSRYFAFNLIAIIVGLPIAIYVSNLWLDTFEFKIDLTSGFFIKAGIWVLVAGLLSVSYYLFRVSFSNPVRFLRRE
jgi:putative ABC transport system permease protein